MTAFPDTETNDSPLLGALECTVLQWKRKVVDASPNLLLYYK